MTVNQRNVMMVASAPGPNTQHPTLKSKR